MTLGWRQIFIILAPTVGCFFVLSRRYSSSLCVLMSSVIRVFLGCELLIRESNLPCASCSYCTEWFFLAASLLKHVRWASTHSPETPLPSSTLSLLPGSCQSLSRTIEEALMSHFTLGLSGGFSQPLSPPFEVWSSHLDHVMPAVAACGRQLLSRTISWYLVRGSGLRMMSQPSILRTAVWTVYDR